MNQKTFSQEDWRIFKSTSKNCKDSVKRGDVLSFYCFEYKADLSILLLLAKAELIKGLINFIMSLFFLDYYPCLIMWVLKQCQQVLQVAICKQF